MAAATGCQRQARELGLQERDPCLHWLQAARNFVEDAEATTLSAVPSICVQYEELAQVAQAVQLHRQHHSNTQTYALTALAQQRFQALKDLLREQVPLQETGINKDDWVADALELLRTKSWRSDQVEAAIAVLPHLKGHPKTRWALQVRLLTQYPQYAVTTRWERTIPLRSYLGKLTGVQKNARLSNLAGAYKAGTMLQSLQLGMLKGDPVGYHYWRGRAWFIKRKYRQALHEFSFKAQGTRERRRIVWYGRTLARLDRLSDAEAYLRRVQAPWDQYRCEALYRRALIAGYNSQDSVQRDRLELGLRTCVPKGYYATSLSWEMWKYYARYGMYHEARALLKNHAALFQKEKLLRAEEVAFWLCYLPELSTDCMANVTHQQDPFLPYAEAIQPGFAPVARIEPHHGPEASRIDLFDAALLRDLRLVGWDSLYFQVLNELYDQFPDGEVEVLLAESLRNSVSVHRSVKKIKTALPRTPSVSWHRMHDLYPIPFRPIVEKEANKVQIDPSLVLGIIREESRYLPTARSWVGALGLMQLMPYTAERLRNADETANEQTLLTPETNIKLGARYLGKLVNEFDGNLIWAIASYNAGEKAVHTWKTRFADVPLPIAMELIPYGQTRKYVKKVLRSVLIYRFRMGQTGPGHEPPVQYLATMPPPDTL